ncbi:hypothetical protein [Desulfatirhabdium butyrativorans]|uniref:hypothetical protein n=1 Tax=Desulfatirhabdium butyrativorans TaxID=340467 RepID=UPI00041BAEF0|nr:hypothetical protein [Desulfatirhabdium butyrativorans]
MADTTGAFLFRDGKALLFGEASRLSSGSGREKQGFHSGKDSNIAGNGSIGVVVKQMLN